MENQHPLLPEQEITFNIDFLLLRDTVRRKMVKLGLAGLLTFGAYTGYRLMYMPQQYMAETSIAMQQTNASVGGLSSLLNGNGGSRKYIGLLHSRNLATTVARQSHLAARLHLKNEGEALNMLMPGIQPDDSSDGLLFIRVTLNGPSVLDADPKKQGDQVRLAVADCANLYAQALGKYYNETSSERDNVLLRIAEDERKEARANYDTATNRVRAFVASWSHLNVRNTPSGGNIESQSPNDIMGLYQQIDQIDTDIRTTLVAQDAQKRLTAEQLQNLGTLPAEDSLLNNARSAYHTADFSLRRMSDLYGPDNPKLKDAQDNLKRAKEELERQQKGIQQARTSDQVGLRKQLEILHAKRDKLTTLIASQENNLYARRQLAARLEILRTEQGIAQQRWQSAEAKAVDVRLSTVTGKSMVTVVDEAQVPGGAMAPPSRSVFQGIVAGIMVMGLMTIVEYLRQMRRHTLAALNFSVVAPDLSPDDLPKKTEGVRNGTTKNGETKNGGPSDAKVIKRR